MSAISFIKKIFKKETSACSVVIVAAGLSQRCNGEDKLFFKLGNKPVLAHTIEVFQNSEQIKEIVVVTRENCLTEVEELCKKNHFSKVSHIIKGGQSRFESVLNGVFMVSKKSALIAIHDGARPCVDTLLIEKTIEKAIKYHASAPALKVSPTIKRIENGVIVETLDRESLFEIQTPQIFKAELIKAALTNVHKKSISVTDDCQAVEILGGSIHVVEGSNENIKITNTTDLVFADLILKNRGNL